MNNKCFYCPKCKNYPDKICEGYHSIDELREWNGECYELISSSLEDPDETRCAECDTQLEGK